MLIQPTGEIRVPVPGRWAVVVLRLLAGILLLTEMGLAAGHSHHGELTSSSHCAVCQVVGLDLESGSLGSGPPSREDVREEWVFSSPPHHAPAPSVPGLFPRGPPPLA